MDWQNLVNEDQLLRWMDSKQLEDGPLQNAHTLTGGTQNLLLRFRRGAREFVLRRPPQRPIADGNLTMRREARLLAALAETDVPHPRLIAACGTDEVLGAAFYLMEPVDGFLARGQLPPLHAGSAEIRRRMGLALVDGITALGRVDYNAVGLSDFGKVDGFLERQVSRWRKQLDSYSAFSGWVGLDELPHVNAIGLWLEKHRPRHFTPGILHGDYHLSNVMFRHDGPELAAIVDWELCTIGDPLIDLGWLLAIWPGAEPERNPLNLDIDPWEGFPSRDELIEHYALDSTRDLSAVEWYAVFACYKLAIILEGTHARACRDPELQQTGDEMHAYAQALLRRAGAWIGC